MVFLQRHCDSQRSWMKTFCLGMKCSVSLKKWRKRDKWRTKEMACLTHEQYPVPKQDRTYASGPLCHPSTFHWCLIRHGEYGRLTWQAILKNYHYIRRRDFDFTMQNTSGNTVITMDRPPQSQDHNRCQQSGLISQHPRSFGCLSRSWRTFSEDYLKKKKKYTSFPKRVQAKHKACWIENYFEMPQQERWLKII